MPITYSFDKERKGIYTKCIGDVTLVEVLDHFRILLQDPECPDCLDVLLDLSETASVPESGQLRDVSAEIGRTTGEVQFGACAIVATSDVLFGMSRMFEVFAGKWFRAIRVFRAISEGEAWLHSGASLSDHAPASHQADAL